MLKEEERRVISSVFMGSCQNKKTLKKKILK
jgi:hypothetical protein